MLAAVAVAGYVAGRVRPGERLEDWAWAHLNRGCRDVRWWAAQGIGFAMLGYAWTIHPRRSAANRRSWREAERAPTPVFDGQWMTKRHDDGEAS
jgi:hypothetical protein